MAFHFFRLRRYSMVTVMVVYLFHVLNKTKKMVSVGLKTIKSNESFAFGRKAGTRRNRNKIAWRPQHTKLSGIMLTQKVQESNLFITNTE